MSGNGFGGLDKLLESLFSIKDDKDRLFIKITKHMTADFLAEVKKRTPVGQGVKANVKGRLVTIAQGGTLRRNWRAGNIQKSGSYWTSTVYNPTEYASYVEYGHRQTPGRFVPAIGKRLKRSWVEGQHMMQISADNVIERSESYIKVQVETFFKERFK